MSAGRRLLRSPGFTAVAVLILAVGLGASATVFTLVESVLLRPLPYPDPQRLVMVWGTSAGQSGVPAVVSPTNAMDWRRQASSFNGLAVFNLTYLSFRGPRGIQRFSGTTVSADYFDIVGIRPALGRPLADPDGVPNAPAVIVVSHRLWMEHLDGDAQALGRPLETTGRSYEVVGVMPEDFEAPEEHFLGRPEFWIPAQGSADASLRGTHYARTFARLRDGVVLEQASREVSAIAAQLAASFPVTNAGSGALVVPLHDQVVGDVRGLILVLAGAVAMVHLIVCANVAGLVLSRGLARSRELALRSAHGAGRWRLAQGAAIEGVILAIMGASLAALITAWAVAAIVNLWPALPRAGQVAPGPSVLLFTFCEAIITSVIFGVLPGIVTSRVDAWPALQQSRRIGSRGRTQRRLRHILVVAEIALSLVLLIGSVLLVRNFMLLISRDTGFSAGNVLTARVELPGQLELATSLDAVLGTVRAMPGVSSAGAITTLPFYGLNNVGMNVRFETDRFEVDRFVRYRSVTVGYFESMGLRLRSGRVFTDMDRSDSARVVVINTEAARRVFGEASPLGRTMSIPHGMPFKGKIVGVVDGVRHEGLLSGVEPEVYVPYAQRASSPTVFLAVRGEGGPQAVAAALPASVRAVQPDAIVDGVQPLRALVWRSVAREQLNTVLMALLSTVALALAMVGLYAIVSYEVRSRTREIGIRLALGARPADVLRGVLLDASRLVGAGVATGLVLSIPFAAWISRFLVEVRPHDSVTFIMVPVAVAAVALLATWVPARRASRVDPAEPLRTE